MEDDLRNKNNKVIELERQYQSKMREYVETDSKQSNKFSQYAKKLDMTQAELQRMQSHLQETQETHRLAMEDKDQRVLELSEQVRLLTLNEEAHASLQADYSELKGKFNTTQEELSRNAEALRNLQMVLEQLQLQNQKTADQLARSQRASQQNEQSGQELAMLRERCETQQNDLKQQRTKLSSNNKYVLRLESKVAALTQALETTLKKMKSSYMDGDQVDRRIVNNLLVRFIERFNKGEDHTEVLELMVKILRFSEEELDVLGYKRDSGVLSSAWSLATAWMPSIEVSGPPEPATIENRDLTDLWVDFLLRDEDAKTAEVEVEQASSESPQKQEDIT